MSKLKAVLFDWDGTLFDSCNNLQFKNVANQLGWEVPNNINEIILSSQSFGKKPAEVMRSVWPEISEEEMRQFESIWFRLDLQNVDMIHGSIALLGLLKWSGVLLGVVTQRTQKHIEVLIEQKGMDYFFDQDLIQGRDAWEYTKPDPRVFELIFNKLKRKGVDPDKDKILFVGDALTDMDCVNGHNIEFVAVTSGPINKETWIESGMSEQKIFDNPIDLGDWIVKKGILN